MGRRVRFFTAATLVNRLGEAQKPYQLERLLTQLDRAELLVCDELGYLSLSRTGAELLFQVFADRYERGSLLVTSNLPLERVVSDLPGGADDGGVARPALPPLPHLRDEWRELPVPRVDEVEEGPKGRVIEAYRYCPERPIP